MKSPQPYLIALFALTTIGGLMLAWQQYGELTQLRTAAMNRDERADLQKRLWDLEKQNRLLRDRIAAARPAGGPDGPPGAPESLADEPPRGGRPGRGGNPIQQANALRELMARPEVVALLNSQQKAAVDARYAALFRSLNLTPEQAEKLRNILADRQTTMQDVMNVAREQGIDPRTDRDAYQKLLEVARNDINASIKSVIGESGFAQFETYEQTLPQRNVVNQLQQRLSQSDTPLSPQQADQLVQILAANTPPSPARPAGAPPPPPDGGPGPGGRGGGPDIGTFIGGALFGGPAGGGPPLLAGGPDGGRAANSTAPITANAITQSQAVLSGPQVTALQQLQQQQQNQQQLSKIINEAIATQNTGNPARGGPPPPAPTKKSGG